MIDPELRSLLQKNLEASEESLSILKGVRRAQRINSAFTILKWLIIIGFSLGIFYYLEPYIQKTIDVYTSLNSTVSGIQDTTQNGQGLLERVRNLISPK